MIEAFRRIACGLLVNEWYTALHGDTMGVVDLHVEIVAIKGITVVRLSAAGTGGHMEIPQGSAREFEHDTASAKTPAVCRDCSYGAADPHHEREGVTEVVRVLAIIEQFREVNECFSRILRHSLPELPDQELEWRKHFAIGAMAHTASASDIIALASGGVCDPADVEGTITRLTSFIVAGLRAPIGIEADVATIAVTEA